VGPTPFYGARVEKKTQKAHFAMKQTNICRLSGDIITECRSGADPVSRQSARRWQSWTRRSLPLLSARPAVIFPAREHHRPLAVTKLYCLVAEAHGCEQLDHSHYLAAERTGIKCIIITKAKMSKLFYIIAKNDNITMAEKVILQINSLCTLHSPEAQDFY